ncbi:SH2 domain protein [Necator americanus]|uniref:Tyrosine-protein kinase n=1 Tax=Necator americanus TaxID=51031 RepID=W2TWN4_NECAM|nr:SH2 domain protein [Necator americanus]ETN85476.1 SH2 domain protein [Necator americanus]
MPMETLEKEENSEVVEDQYLVDKATMNGSSYYHGMIPAQDVADLLEKDGDFLLRKEEIKGGLLTAALSVRSGGDVKHFVVNKSDQGEFYIETLKAKTIEELVRNHLSTGEPLSQASQVVLKRAIPRQEWMLNHEDILLKQSMGRRQGVEEFIGEFMTNNGTRQVFLKTLGISCSSETKARFMKEVRLLRSLNHQNVGEIYGVALHHTPITLVLEYFAKSLSTHLRQNVGRISDAEKRRFVCEAAAGLAYLAENNCIHRDIAARNCKLNDVLEVKISGFSLCVPKKEMHDEQNMQIAVKWQAPEVLKDRNFSFKSDVWSFGVLMWEVYSDGAEPYSGMSPSAAMNAILKEDFRMPIPKDCPEEISKIMSSCWETFPRKRPCMQAIFLVIRDF